MAELLNSANSDWVRWMPPCISWKGEYKCSIRFKIPSGRNCNQGNGTIKSRDSRRFQSGFFTLYVNSNEWKEFRTQSGVLRSPRDRSSRYVCLYDLTRETFWTIAHSLFRMTISSRQLHRSEATAILDLIGSCFQVLLLFARRPGTSEQAWSDGLEILETTTRSAGSKTSSTPSQRRWLISHYCGSSVLVKRPPLSDDH